VIIYLRKIDKKKYNLLKYRLYAILTFKTFIHFLHIGKNGGTAIKYALQINKKPYFDKDYIIVGHKHNFKLENIYPWEKVFFVVRDPIDRFISGFYSRKRKGQPRIYEEWSDKEKIAFENFNTPNDLALSLIKTNSNYKQAVEAMNSIGHVKTSYWDWFKNEKYFLRRKKNIIFIAELKELNKDFKKFKQKLNIPDYVRLPKDKIKKHSNPIEYDKKLDEKSILNLKKWYSKDYDFIRLVKENK